MDTSDRNEHGVRTNPQVCPVDRGPAHTRPKALAKRAAQRQR